MDVHRLWSHETTLVADGVSAARARAFVSQHLLNYGLRDLVDDIELVVSELATNSVVHAQTSFTVSLCASADTVRLQVSDGSGAEPVLVLGGSLDPDERGLVIVQALSRDWGVLSGAVGGKSVCAPFNSGGPAACGPASGLAP